MDFVKVSEQMVAKEICAVAKVLHRFGWLAAADGNISVRTETNRVLITPSGVSKARMSPEQMAAIDMSGNEIMGRASTEREMHLAIYKTCTKARAVVHAHPPHAIAWTISHPQMRELPYRSMSELIIAAGRIPIADYARPGTVQMAQVLEPFLPEFRLIILGRHGALAWGETLEEALSGMERLEHSAHILKLALDMGQLSELPAEEVEYLQSLRKKLGEKVL
jgi:L-fuculose-phosphate aldolase